MWCFTWLLLLYLCVVDLGFFVELVLGYCVFCICLLVVCVVICSTFGAFFVCYVAGG